MPKAVVAVGGTGKRVTLLYLKLANTLRTADAHAPGQAVFVVDMDPEPGTPDEEINKELQREGVPAGNFISPVHEDARVDRIINLCQYMKFERANTVLPVAHALFNTDQLNIQVIKGMNCEPTVGATVGAYRFNPAFADDEVRAFANGLSRYAPILVVTSIIGGTGAGVTPQLVNWIRALDSQQNRAVRPIYGVLFLRWIHDLGVDLSGPTDTKTTGNAKAWLDYLVEHHPENPRGSGRKIFDHYLMVDPPEGMQLSTPNTNAHHPLHLLGAIYLLQFDKYLQAAPGSTGPHYLQLNQPLSEDAVDMGDDTLAKAVIREKLFTAVIREFRSQRPDEALSPFSLFLKDRLSMQPFVRTLAGC